MVVTSRAVVIGAGIGGLAAAVGLQQAGWEVTVCERAAALEAVGAGLAVAPNGLRALDVLGAGDEIRSLAIAQEPGIRRRDGRWLARSSGRMVAARFGDPVVLLARAALMEALLSRLAGQAMRLSTPVTAVEPGGESRPALVTTTAGEATPSGKPRTTGETWLRWDGWRVQCSAWLPKSCICMSERG
jgi:2-polyprenyl-6-methoxyphenol hydroxylase-like FAD-dependent oxidoreductase